MLYIRKTWRQGILQELRTNDICGTERPHHQSIVSIPMDSTVVTVDNMVRLFVFPYSGYSELLVKLTGIIIWTSNFKMRNSLTRI